MEKAKIKIIGLVLISLFFVYSPAFAQTPPPSQTTGGIIKQQEQLETGRELEERIQKPPEGEEEGIPGEEIGEEEGEQVMINDIIVEGVTLIPEGDIDAIVSEYEGQEISLRTMQKVADLITDEYRQRGYVTSRAYIPPQTIREGTLIIRVVEGSLGNVEIRGNRYFTEKLLKKNLRLDEGQAFDYSDFQKSLAYINEHPDRTARAVLVPGEAPGTTDIVVDIEDNYPFHFTYEYDNYGSQFIEKDRWGFAVEHNNLFGWDHQLYMKYQLSEYDYYEAKNIEYVIPFNRNLKTGFYFIRTDTELGGPYKMVNAKGEAKIYGWYLNKVLINKPDVDLRLNFGFDYKDIKNYLLGILNSYDRVRLVKLGIDLDILDKWGRTIFTPEFNYGIPDMWGGLDEKDPMASRAGAGGKFVKWIVNLYRLQPGPFSSSILIKNQAQFSPYTLPASEEFQIGGPVSVRGYPAAEYAGDMGYYTSFEWSFPFYILPKNMRVPFTQDMLYDAFRIVLFYDWATVHRDRVPVGTQKHDTLKSCGFGFRLNLTNDVSARVEFGYPLGEDSSDGHSMQRWVEVVAKF